LACKLNRNAYSHFAADQPMSNFKKSYRTRGKGLSHPAVRILILLNVIAWGVGLYIYFNRETNFEIANPGQIAIEKTQGKTDTESYPLDVNEAKEEPDPSDTIEKQESIVASKDSSLTRTSPVSYLQPEETSTKATSNNPAPITIDQRPANLSQIRYTVANGKAHFHNRPDPSTRRKAFINHWNKAILQPLDVKNGFIYIIYTNPEGQTSKGWMWIKDLQLVRN